ncbi:MAG TPA: hypothetical protein VFM37_11300 [Pseudonocardiaceae bacterium]|nr:hypothetical protein [Pseudonocardiaceae bacterium]
MADRTSVARQQVAEQAARHREPVGTTAQATATALLVEWWAAAQRHGVSPDDISFVTSLSATALDSVLFAQRRAMIRGWSQ